MGCGAVLALTIETSLLAQNQPISSLCICLSNVCVYGVGIYGLEEGKTGVKLRCLSPRHEEPTATLNNQISGGKFCR